MVRLLETAPEAFVMGPTRTIGRLAKEAGVGVETIRFYERRGVIEQPRKSEGPRHYDDRTLAMRRYLRLAQQLGFSLKEIQALRAMVEEKLVSLAREAEAIVRLQGELKAFLARCRARDPNLPCPIVEELT